MLQKLFDARADRIAFFFERFDLRGCVRALLGEMGDLLVCLLQAFFERDHTLLGVEAGILQAFYRNSSE